MLFPTPPGPVRPNSNCRRQQLSGRDFRGCDLRGCDFTGAQLVGCQWGGATLGKSGRQATLLALVGLASSGLAADAIHRLVWSSLGHVPGDPAWPLSLLLLGILTAIALLQVLGATESSRLRPLRRFSCPLRNALVGALLGFFWLGRWGLAPKLAFAGAGLGAIAALLSSRNRWARFAWEIMAWVAVYGLAYLASHWASAALSTQNWWLGMLFSAVVAAALGLSVQGLPQLVQHYRNFPGTCFNRANLRQAQFALGDRPHLDLQRALGTDEINWIESD